MSLELARVKLRGIYAIVAGAVLLLGIPLYQSLYFANTGYTTAVDAISKHGDFKPLLAWINLHTGADVTSRLLYLLPLLAMTTLPGSLRRVLWPGEATGGRVMLWSGRIGFGCYALASVVGIVASISGAASYRPTSPSNSGPVAAFAAAYAWNSLLAHIIGGGLIALCILLVSLRILRAQTVLPWLGIVGLLEAALLAIVAIQYSAGLKQAQTTLQPFSFVMLALWLISMGTQLAWLRALPSATPANDAPANATASSAGSSRQSAGQAPSPGTRR
ncbi:MAG TPA: hypothetical protein VGR88_00275 [Ktedonobacterales bacterium]|nr:hypothetical protein [Ktedonobacterales bacterium]